MTRSCKGRSFISESPNSNKQIDKQAGAMNLIRRIVLSVVAYSHSYSLSWQMGMGMNHFKDFCIFDF
jgi:hypothetical protein